MNELWMSYEWVRNELGMSYEWVRNETDDFLPKYWLLEAAASLPNGWSSSARSRPPSDDKSCTPISFYGADGEYAEKSKETKTLVD